MNQQSEKVELKSPATPSGAHDARPLKTARGDWFWWRFCIALVVMIGINLLPLVASWRAYRFDGLESVGFPFVVFERGGQSYVENFYVMHLLADCGIAVVVATVAALALRDGWRALWHRLRAWGVEEAA